MVCYCGAHLLSIAVHFPTSQQAKGDGEHEEEGREPHVQRQRVQEEQEGDDRPETEGLQQPE